MADGGGEKSAAPFLSRTSVREFLSDKHAAMTQEQLAKQVRFMSPGSHSPLTLLSGCGRASDRRGGSNRRGIHAPLPTPSSSSTQHIILLLHTGMTVGEALREMAMIHVLSAPLVIRLGNSYQGTPGGACAFPRFWQSLMPQCRTHTPSAARGVRLILEAPFHLQFWNGRTILSQSFGSSQG